MVECHSCLCAAQTSVHLRDSERSIICESPVRPSGGLGIISWLSGALANRVVRGVTHTVTPKGNVDTPRRVIHQWVHEPSSVPQVPLLPPEDTKSRGSAPADADGADELLKCAPYAAGSSPRTRPCISLFSCRTCP